MHLFTYIKKITFTLITLLFGSLAAYSQTIKGDSITIAVEPSYNDVSGAHRTLFGENYRTLWATPVTMKVFYLEKENGLRVIEQGGGKQTRSLKLKDKEGHDWALRTVQKYPDRALPPNLRKTIVKDILQDEVSTSHPFSALIVPPLAEALGIPHSNPQIVYVADDPALGKFRKEYANHVFLFEERDPLDVDKSDNSEKAEKKLEADNDNRVEQKLVLRARLLDIIMGDWDRHEDQWRWVHDKGDTGIVYTPIPRDRDKVFYTTSGIFPWVLAHQFLKSQLQPYRSDIRDVPGWNFNARYFDRYFLTQLSEDDWKEQIADVQKLLTDSLIESAMKRMPPVIYKMSAAQLITALKGRRDNLSKIALTYYNFLADHVDIPATDKQELFTVNEQAGGKVEVTINKIKKSGDTAQVIYHRIFDPTVTKEIRLYGMGGKDIFNVGGTEASPIKIRMIGGDGVDSFYVAPKLNAHQDLYVYDRSDQKNMLPSGADAKIRTSTDTSVNYFDRTAFKYNNTSPIVLANYSTDEGIILIGGMLFEKQGFRKEPYRYHQTILAGYSLGRESLSFSYNGDFKKAIGNNDLFINVLSRGPHNVANFFGIGNNTQFKKDDDHGIEYYRNHYNTINLDGRLYHNYQNSWQVNYGLVGQVYYSPQSQNTGHFLDEYNQQNPGEKVYNARAYAGVIGGLRYDTRDNIINPASGVYWNTDVFTATGLVNSHSTYAQVLTEFNTYFNPDKDSVLIVANRVGGGTIIGHAEYFQQMRLGGPRNLRGFHTNRFTGHTMAYDNFELRLKLFNFNSYLFPGTVGMVGFNDVGRVWVPGESSDEWHWGYGGGFYIIPARVIIFQAALGWSKDGMLTYLNFGFRF
ncbi:BamA/TamA family outer membrane protein [Mucilaginibacter agri]|uniref:BamA/TamA family outer membrane protein n=1 Tax=Mucilaginibacter agri TaxID=2695265 RepID=A0A966DTJ6_9SPHI|nr:BamA/TamA family outer membrane protein [Mucilaginibacter agri]NCD68754.1 BamA/TamA family outer membrane protein [Mucilaginibacter agri]